MELTKPTQVLESLASHGDMMRHEHDSSTAQSKRVPRYQSHSLEECITNLTTPRGPKPVLKSMVTTACERNCFYCPFRAGRGKTARVTFTPDAVAGAFDTLVRAKKVDGLFLSSGIIKGSVTTQDKLIDTVQIIRRKYNYRGYVHLKVMPGIERDQLAHMMRIADRVSVNLEAPTEQRLADLAPKKEFLAELLQMLRWAQDIRAANPDRKLASTVTQFVVGAVGDTDLELLSLSENLYRQLGLARVYYSAFSPVSDTPLENVSAASETRQHRLYQASFLLRDYGWSVEDLGFASSGFLPESVDPKRAYADVVLRNAPIDLQTADREHLMRVPHIGPKAVDRLIKARQQTRIIDLAQLRALGIARPDDLAPYVLLDGRRPPQQLTLFPGA
ncbi:MAG: radical SAM protein [Chloroflexi bacterium]|nr:radical SAM protein [Chloroflexota bacterium]